MVYSKTVIQPLKRRLFSAPVDQDTCTAQAVHPVRTAGFSLNLSEGVALCGAREIAAPAAGQKGRDTYVFPSSLNSYLSLAS